mgnify:CR=1 FL=1
MVENNIIIEIQKSLINWFEEEGREFPWRISKNPFHILISEKLLQQTIAREQVIKAYETLIKRYPSAEGLAKAQITDIRSIIKPLGLLYRAIELLTMAGEIEERYQGVVPNNIEELLSLTGVGDYSARAVLSFAYNKDEPIVDTNVARFLFRFLGLEGSIPQNPARSKILRKHAKALIPKGNSRNFNFAILDLCSKICKPRKPLCSKCPIQPLCEYGTSKITD